VTQRTTSCEVQTHFGSAVAMTDSEPQGQRQTIREDPAVVAFIASQYRERYTRIWGSSSNLPMPVKQIFVRASSMLPLFTSIIVHYWGHPCKRSYGLSEQPMSHDRRASRQLLWGLQSAAFLCRSLIFEQTTVAGWGTTGARTDTTESSRLASPP